MQQERRRGLARPWRGYFPISCAVSRHADLQQQFDGKATVNMKARIMQPGDPEGDFTITLDESMFEDVSPDATRVVVRGRLEAQDFSSDEQYQ